MYVAKYQGKTIKNKYNDEAFEVLLVGVFTNALNEDDQYTLCCIADTANNKDLRATPCWVDKYFDII